MFLLVCFACFHAVADDLTSTFHTITFFVLCAVVSCLSPGEESDNEEDLKDPEARFCLCVAVGGKTYHLLIPGQENRNKCVLCVRAAESLAVVLLYCSMVI